MLRVEFFSFKQKFCKIPGQIQLYLIPVFDYPYGLYVI